MSSHLKVIMFSFSFQSLPDIFPIWEISLFFFSFADSLRLCCDKKKNSPKVTTACLLFEWNRKIIRIWFLFVWMIQNGPCTWFLSALVKCTPISLSCKSWGSKNKCHMWMMLICFGNLTLQKKITLLRAKIMSTGSLAV